MKQLLIFCIAVLLNAYCVSGQSIQHDIITTSGLSYSNNKNVVSWTIGETFIATYNNNNNIVTQGFQQVYFSFTEIPENKEAKFTLNVYPNPATDFVNIDIQSEDLNGTYNLVINDVNGQIIQKQNFKHKSTLRIDLSSIKSELVILKVTHKETGSQRVFKIVKSNK